MKFTILAATAILLPAGIWAQGFDVKPGLWESTATVILSGAPPIPESALANLPKEKRDQIMAMMSQPHTSTNKVCLTREVLSKGMNFATAMGSNSECTQKTNSLSSGKMEIHIECTGQNSFIGDAEIDRVDSEHAKGTMTAKSSGGRGAGSTGR